MSKVEYDVLPKFRDIDRFLELPAALILPLSLSFRPLQFIDENSLTKKLLNRYSKYLNIALVFQKLILFINEPNHLLKKTESCKVRDKCIICIVSSIKNLCPNLF